MSKKISDLPAAAAVLGTDQIETNQGGVSKRWTPAQIAEYLNTIDPLQLSTIRISGVVDANRAKIRNDGSGFFADGQILLNADGSSQFDGPASFTASVSVGLDLNVTGNVVVQGSIGGAGSWSINPDGSGNLSAGLVTFNAVGEFTAAAYFVGGSAGATQDVVIGGTTLHFIGGLFVGTTP